MINQQRINRKAPIFENPEEYQRFARSIIKSQLSLFGQNNICEAISSLKYTVVTSGGYDPIHPGHISYLQEAKTIIPGKDFFHIAVVNGDNFLTNKKGSPFMDLDTRAKIVSAIDGVDAVIKFEIKDDSTVIEALKIIQPTYFLKGGDRKDKDSVPESEICQSLGIEMIFGVGIEKTQSSSSFIRGASNGK